MDRLLCYKQTVEKSKSQLERLIRGAIGQIKADFIVTGGKMINVYSGEILDGMDIAVLDGRICYVGPNAKHTRGDTTEILDARGLYIAPGFMDAHTHIAHYCRPYEYLQAYLPHGTTALVSSADELAAVLGYEGVKLFLAEVAAHPVRVYSLISMVAPQDPLLCSTRSLSQAEIAEGLNDPRVLGLGEIVSWLRLLRSGAVGKDRDGPSARKNDSRPYRWGEGSEALCPRCHWRFLVSRTDSRARRA